MAYRTIKGNTGSSTAGVDKRTIHDLAKLNEEKYVALIQKQFKSYHPRPVRRVEIPKPNGKTRPLGIPTIVDRIVQQCVLQVLEPICEAKFYDHSYGFRPNRSTEHAIARCDQLIQLSHLYYVVDIDIKGFFDNVNHTKLIQQMWEMGIQDKRLLCIIREMLKAPIVLSNGEILHPSKGTPQGGICGNTYKRVTYRGRHFLNCTTFQTKGKSECTAKKIPEDTLMALTLEVLGIDRLSTKVVKSKITEIRAEKSNVVVFCMEDGSEIVKRWKDRSRAESWTPEMKEQARQRALQARRKKE